MKKLTAMLLALAMALSLAACAGESTPSAPPSTPPVESTPAEESTPSATPAPEESAEPSAAVDDSVAQYYLEKADEVVVNDDSVTFTDDSGRDALTIAKDPKNVAVLYGSLAALWYEAGGAVQVAIGGDSAVTLYEEQIGRDFTKDEGVTIVAEGSSGTVWDVETILAAKPDLIVCSMGMKGYETIGGPAEAANIPVIGIDYDGVQDYLKWFKVFCNLDGHPELWDSVANTTAQNIASIVSSVPSDVEAKTSVTLTLNSGDLKAYTSASQPGVIINELGGVNLVDPDGSAKGSSLELSMEDLFALDPDIIFVSEYGEPGLTRQKLDELTKDNPVWDSLRAVKEDHVIFLEKNLFHNKANRMYDQAYRTMAQHLYPDYQF